MRTRTLSDMGALDRHLYTSQHASTDTVARLGPDRVQLARNGCSFLPSIAQLSLPRDCTRKDGNPLVDGRLTVRLMRRVDWTVERMGDQVAEAIVCFGVTAPKGRLPQHILHTQVSR